MLWTTIDWGLLWDNVWIHLNGYSFFTAMLLFALFGLCIRLLRYRTFFLKKCSSNLLFFAIVLAVLRMVLPLRFHLSHSFYSTDLLTELWSWYRTPLAERSVRVWQLLVGVWMSGVVFGLLRCLFSYCKIAEFSRKARNWQENRPLWREKLEKLQGQKDKRAELIISPLVVEPMSGGFFHGVIYLPADLPEERVDMVLAHECCHIQRRDTLKKVLFHLMHCLFWFHPAFLWLKKDLHQILELQCDHAVTEEMNEEEKRQYFHALLEQVQKNYTKEKPLHNYFFRESDFHNIKQRLEILMDWKQERKRKRRVVSYLFLLWLFVFSYSIIFVPDYVPEEALEGECFIDEDSPYTVRNFWLHRPDGKYELVENLKTVKVVRERKDHLEYPVIEQVK